MIKKVFFLLLLCALASSAKSQTCQEQTTGFPAERTTFATVTPGDIIGQTFMPCKSGMITTLKIKLDETVPNTYTGTFDLRIGVEPGEGMFLGGPAYQTVDINDADPTGVVTIHLNTPFPVSLNTTYRFEINNHSAELVLDGYVPGIAYPSGDIVNESGGYNNAGDLNFCIDISSPVPTLSEWGLIILGLTLNVFGTVA